MNIQDFIKKTPYLYHLTDSRNLKYILSQGRLFSAQVIVDRTDLEIEEKNKILHERRPIHKEVILEGNIIHIRDQRPISIKNLEKCLTSGWTVPDFLILLNSRVFFWPNIKRLNSHFCRYVNENPVILRIQTSELLKINPNPEFCRLNSGATRSSSYFDGAPPQRGQGSFLLSEDYKNTVSSVAEVTFPNYCILPSQIDLGYQINGPWTNQLV